MDSAVVATLRSQRIELPSWAFGNSGTRFKVFAQQGVPRDPYEKIADAAQVNRFTGVAPTVALHIPWDKVDDYADLARHAARLRRRPRDDQLEHVPGRRLHARQRLPPGRAGPAEGRRPSPRVRRHHGRDRLARPEAVVRRRHELSGPGRHPRPPGPARRIARPRSTPGSATDQRIVLEYKLFEPSFYTMDVPDWGTALIHCLALGDKAKVVVDTGHHAPGTNIEFIVASLLRLGRLGGFDFNSRFYADDDLMVGAADPFQLFRIMVEVVGAGGLDPAVGVAFMLDQCHNIEPKIPGQIRSVMNVQEATAKALLVDREALGGGPARRRRPRRERRPDGRLQHGRPADARRGPRGARPGPGPDGRLRPVRATPSGSSTERVGGQPGRLGRMSLKPARRRPRRGRGRLDARRAVEPARRGPAEHELRGRQHLGQGLGDRSGDRRAGRAALGQGLRRRPRDADRGAGSRCSGWTGCARSSTSIRASSARTRWSARSTTASSAGAGRRRRSTPRCTASSTPTTSTTSIRTPGSRSRRPPTGRS